MILLKLNLLVLDVLEKNLSVGTVKWRQTRDHFVQNDTKAPPIDWEAVFVLVLQYLRRQIFGSSNKTARLVALGHILLRKPEVS